VEFNHDSISDFVIYSGGTWAVKSGAGGNAYIEQGVTLGGPSDLPFVGDFNHDGVSDFAVYQSGMWSARSGAGGNAMIEQGVPFGGAGDVPLTGDAIPAVTAVSTPTVLSVGGVAEEPDIGVRPLEKTKALADLFVYGIDAVIAAGVIVAVLGWLMRRGRRST